MFKEGSNVNLRLVGGMLCKYGSFSGMLFLGSWEVVLSGRNVDEWGDCSGDVSRKGKLGNAYISQIKNNWSVYLCIIIIIINIIKWMLVKFINIKVLLLYHKVRLIIINGVIIYVNWFN